MPALKNPKHELFARYLFEGMKQGEAYEKSGYIRHDGSASNLRQNPKIQARIEEMQEIKARAAGLTKDYVISNLIEIVDMHRKSNPSAAAKSLELLGKTDGLKMFTDKSEQRTIKDVADLSEDELVAIARSILARQMPEDDDKPPLKVVNKD